MSARREVLTADSVLQAEKGLKIGEHAGKVVGIILVSGGNSKRKCSVFLSFSHEHFSQPK